MCGDGPTVSFVLSLWSCLPLLDFVPVMLEQCCTKSHCCQLPFQLRGYPDKVQWASGSYVKR